MRTDAYARPLIACAKTLLLGIVLVAVPSGFSDDWPQILGPGRNGVAVNESPIEAWGGAGPARRWSVPVGSGYAGPAVVGDRVILFHRVKAIERVECFDTTTGKSMWQSDFRASYRPGVNPDDGPRCVPLVHEQRIYVCGAAGDLHCVQLMDGRAVWSRDAYSDFGGQEGYFGAGSTPIVADQKLLVNVGGRNAGIVAFDLANGQTRWQATDERASYSSPTIAEINNAPHAIFVTRLKCLAIDPRTGKLGFSFPFGITGPTVNAATPLVFDNHLFVTASYGVGARFGRLADPATSVWANDDSMSSHYSTCIFHGGHLFGMHGREDAREGELRCIEARTGKVKWTSPAPLTGNLILVGDQLLILTTDANLILAEARGDKHVERARTSVPGGTTRSLPAYSRGKLFFRDNAESRARLTCLELGPKK